MLHSHVGAMGLMKRESAAAPVGATRPGTDPERKINPTVNDVLCPDLDPKGKKKKKKWVWSKDYTLKKDIDTETINSLSWMKTYEDPDGKKMTSKQIAKSYNNFDVWFAEMVEVENQYSKDLQVRALVS